jgi:hypothetical protein
MTDRRVSMGQSVESSPPENRAEHYRELAKDAVQMAQEMLDKDRSAEFLAMAASWHNLAVEAEQKAAHRMGITSGVSRAESSNYSVDATEARTAVGG